MYFTIQTRSVVFYYANTFSCILLYQHVQLYFTIPTRSVVFYYTNTFSCILLHVQLYFTMPTRSVVFNYTFSCIFIVLTHWNNSILVEMSLHSETSFWFRSQPFFVHACLEEKQQIPGLAWPGIRTSIYHTRDKHSNHYTTEVVLEPLFLTMNFYNIPQNDLYLTNGSNKKKYDSGLYQCNGTIFINLSFWTYQQFGPLHKINLERSFLLIFTYL